MTTAAEIRLAVIKHIATMMLEMSEVDFDNISKEDEELLLEDYEEVATHILDSLGFSPIEAKESDSVRFSADFRLIEPEKYIQNFLEK